MIRLTATPCLTIAVVLGSVGSAFRVDFQPTFLKKIGEIKMTIIGGLLIALGILDFGLSLVGLDLYGEMGIPLSGFVYYYSPVFAIILGGVLIWWKEHSKKCEESLRNLDEGEALIEKRTVKHGKSIFKQKAGYFILTNQRLMILSTGEISNDGSINYDESQGDIVISVRDIISVKTGFIRIKIRDRKGDEYKISPGQWAVPSLSATIMKAISDQSENNH